MGVKKRRSPELIRERFVRGYVRAYIQGKTSEKWIISMVGYVPESIDDIRISENSTD